MPPKKGLVKLVRARGFEPRLGASEASVLPVKRHPSWFGREDSDLHNGIQSPGSCHLNDIRIEIRSGHPSSLRLIHGLRFLCVVALL